MELILYIMNFLKILSNLPILKYKYTSFIVGLLRYITIKI